MMALALWFLALGGLIVAAAVASGRGRASPNEVASRGVVTTALVAYAAIVAAAAWLWGGAAARDGRDARLAEGAAVEVELAGVRITFDRALAIGHAETADVRIPGEGPAELARITLANDVATVHAAHVAPVGAGQRARDVAIAQNCTGLRTAGAAANAAPQASDNATAGASGSAAYTLPRGTSVVVVECEGERAKRAFVIERGRELIVTPLAPGRGFAPESRALRAGDALRLGGADEPIPGLVTWDVVAPRGAAAMLAIPRDPTDCAAWSPDPKAGRAVDRSCEVTAGPFVLLARPVVPDDAAVMQRGLEAAILIGAPAVLLLGALVASPRRARRTGAFARALRLAALGGGLAALACWRLLWAYRIDATDGGSRVADNQLASIAIGAALAGLIGHERHVPDHVSAACATACAAHGCVRAGAPARGARWWPRGTRVLAAAVGVPDRCHRRWFARGG